MKPINEMKLIFPAKSANEGFSRVALAAFASTLDPTVEEIADIKTAVSEAVTNCIVHAYRESMGQVYIHAKIYSGNRLTVRVRDNGCGIEDVAKAQEPLFTTCETGERAGLGFAVMKSCMDKVRVYSKVGKGTSVILQKTLLSKGAQNA